jgi:hypothetical protein
VGLDTASLANDHATLDLDKWSDKAAFTDKATIKVYGIDNGNPFAESHVHNAYLSHRRFFGRSLHKLSQLTTNAELTSLATREQV